MVLALIVVASSSNAEKFCILPDCAPRRGESHTTSLRHRDVENASSLFATRIACHGIYGPLGLCDHPGQLC
jgi:hypothetical protein